MRCDLLDVVDRLLRIYRDRENEPFGGVQVLLIGDTFQLPPIANGEEWAILEAFYESRRRENCGRADRVAKRAIYVEQAVKKICQKQSPVIMPGFFLVCRA